MTWDKTFFKSLETKNLKSKFWQGYYPSETIRKMSFLVSAPSNCEWPLARNWISPVLLFLHMVFSFCNSTHFLFLLGILIIGYRLILMLDDFASRFLPKLYLQLPLFQIRSNPKTTWEHAFWGLLLSALTNITLNNLKIFDHLTARVMNRCVPI